MPAQTMSKREEGCAPQCPPTAADAPPAYADPATDETPTSDAAAATSEMARQAIASDANMRALLKQHAKYSYKLRMKTLELKTLMAACEQSMREGYGPEVTSAALLLWEDAELRKYEEKHASFTEGVGALKTLGLTDVWPLTHAEPELERGAAELQRERADLDRRMAEAGVARVP